MASPIRQIATDWQGCLVALRLDGTIARQQRADAGLQWRDVPTEEIDGRVVQMTVRHDGMLVVMTAAGDLWEMKDAAFHEKRGIRHWAPMAGP